MQTQILLTDSAHTVAMIRHSMDVVKNAVEHVNHGQTPVVTLDQPLFALAKQIQWKWPEKYGEDKMVVMFGGLHIEMAALKTSCEEVAGYKPWFKLRLQRRERPTPSCELPTAPAQEELIKSLQQHCTYCNTVLMNAINSQSLFVWTLKEMSETMICPLGKLYTASTWSELCVFLLYGPTF